MGLPAVVARRIFVIATDSAGCFHYRLRLPLLSLNRDAFAVYWQPWPMSPQAGDIVIGQRIAGDDQGWLDLCNTPGLSTIYDLDDNLLAIDPENTVPYQIYAPKVEGTKANIAAATAVSVSTQTLAYIISSINSNVAVLPNCVEDSWLNDPVDQRNLVVGWAGSMFHGQDFGGVSQQLQAFSAVTPGTGFHTIGADYFGSLPNKRVSGWAALPSLYQNLSSVTVGIAPLAPTPFNHCKSHIKVLEYAARGIPAVASNVGQYAEFIDHGINGFLMDRVDDLSGLLTKLVDYDERKAMAEAAHATAAEYRISAQAQRWAQVYQGV